MKNDRHLPRFVIACAALALMMGAGCAANPSKPTPPETTPQQPATGTSDLPATEPISPSAPSSADDATTLDLSGRNLTSVPANVFTRTELVELSLTDNALTAIPSEIGKLTHLKVLDLSRNKLTGLPAELGRLTELQALDVSDNQLTGLPLELGNLKNLQILNLSGNHPSQQDLNAIKAKLPDLSIIMN